MDTYISMLRGVNVSGHRRVRMEELERLYLSLGCRNVRTYVQSGNVLFEHPTADISKLAGKIEKRLKGPLGSDVPVLIRTKNEFQRLIESNPFAERDESKVHVTFLYAKPMEFSMDKINKVVGRGEAFSMVGSEIYLFCPNGYGRTKLSNSFFERALKMTATTRNWKTVNTLCSMARTSGPQK